MINCLGIRKDRARYLNIRKFWILLNTIRRWFRIFSNRSKG